MSTNKAKIQFEVLSVKFIKAIHKLNAHWVGVFFILDEIDRRPVINAFFVPCRRFLSLLLCRLQPY